MNLSQPKFSALPFTKKLFMVQKTNEFGSENYESDDNILKFFLVLNF